MTWRLNPLTSELQQVGDGVGGGAVAGALVYKGATDCSANPNYPAADAGHVYIVSVAGKIGGGSGVVVEVGDIFLCKTDGTLTGTQAQRGTAWDVIQSNIVGALLSANNLSDLANAGTARTNLGLGTLATQSGTYSGTSSGSNTGDQTLPVKASGAEVDTGTDDAKFVTPKAIADSALGESAGVTNSAGVNIIPKSDGANLVTSAASDDGTTFAIDEQAQIQAGGSTKFRVGIDESSEIGFGDLDGNSNATKFRLRDSTQTITASTATEQIAIDGSAHTISNSAATSISEVTPLWGAGDNGSKFEIDGNGAISKYREAAPVDGGLMIGHSAAGEYRNGSLTPGDGVSVTPGAGSITIASTIGAMVFSVPVNNTVLAQATGEVLTSPSDAGPPLSSTNEDAVSFPAPRNGTLANLFVRTGTIAKVNNPTSTTIIVKVNGANTDLLVNMTQTVTTTTSNTSDTVEVNQGDLITVSVVTVGGSSISTSIASITFTFE